MTTEIKELVKRLRERYRRHASESNDEARLRRQVERDAAADALEAMAGEVERLKDRLRIANGVLAETTQKALELQTERDRLKAALEQIKTKAPKSSPAMDDDYGANFDDAWSGGWDSGFNAAANIARKALGGDAS